MPKSRRHILLIEDNREVRGAFAAFFESWNDASLQIADGLIDALGHVGRRFVDLVIFDLGGTIDVHRRLDVVRQWRDSGNHFPIIATSAQPYDGLMIEALRAGADDFFRKPYLFGEMGARIQRHLARSVAVLPVKRRVDGVELPEEAFEFGGAKISPDLRIIFSTGFENRLSPKQLGVLRVLANHAGTLVLKQDLIYAVWGRDANANSNSVNQYLYVLRRLYRAGGSNLDDYVSPESKVGWRVAAMAGAKPL